MTMATFGGVVVGVILGILLRLREDPWTAREVIYFIVLTLYPKFLGRWASGSDKISFVAPKSTKISQNPNQT